MKKLLSLIGILFIFNLSFTPAYAAYAKSKETVTASFVSDLNVNKSSKGQVVQFRINESYTDADGKIIPEGSIIAGEIKSFKKGRWAYRRAKVRIELNEIRLPDGTVYQIQGNTKRKVLKGSAVANVSKGIITFPAVLVVGVGGSLVMLFECISIAGIILLVPTGLIIGGLTGKLSNGINCKKHAGDVIKLEYYIK